MTWVTYAYSTTSAVDMTINTAGSLASGTGTTADHSFDIEYFDLDSVKTGKPSLYYETLTIRTLTALTDTSLVTQEVAAGDKITFVVKNLKTDGTL